MNSNNITVTDGRLKKAVKDNIEPLIMPQIDRKIIKAVNESKVQIGYVTKFYQYLDKAEVRLIKSNKKVLCRLPHRVSGDLIDLFTPSGTDAFCNKLNEPCIVPRGKMHCLVLDINDDTDEQFLLDYYTPEDLLGISTPKKGHMRFTCVTATNETYLDFGVDGLSIVSSKPIESSYGEFEDDLKVVDYASSDEVYSKNEVYTKAEVDKIIEDLKEELQGGIE